LLALGAGASAQAAPARHGVMLGTVATGPAAGAQPAATGGKPRIWGSNSFGELGDGDTTNRFTIGPGSVVTDAVEVARGREHVIALAADGTVWAWGSNQYGQIGDGTATNRPTPQKVAGLSGVTMVATGYYTSMALLSDGTVMDWGYNTFGQLG